MSPFAALTTLLEANGYTQEELIYEGDDVTHLEMFLHEYPRMRGLQLFPKLRTLQLTEQNISQVRAAPIRPFPVVHVDHGTIPAA